MPSRHGRCEMVHFLQAQSQHADVLHVRVALAGRRARSAHELVQRGAAWAPR